MDWTAITVSTITATGLVLAALAARPHVGVARRVRRIEGEFRNNGGSSAKDQLDRIENGVAHLRGRFDQHIDESDRDKQAAHLETVRMWAAIEAVAKAAPPEGDQS